MVSSRNRVKGPFFTIITPSFNQGKYICRTIQSVLSQDVGRVEYLIFDGGSCDETVSILESFDRSIRWISEPDKGQAHAVNKGLMAASGEVIGWLNSDDVYYPSALRLVKNFFRQRPDIDILYGMANHIDEKDNVVERYYTEEWNYERLKEVCFICQPAVFFRRSIVGKFGLLDEMLHYCMDYEYWLRIGGKRPFYYLKQIVAGSRLYRESKTLKSSVDVHEEILRMFKKNFGKIPSRWIYNHAHVVARESGLSRETSDKNLKFVKKAALVSIGDSLRLRYYIPLSELMTVVGWYVNARKAANRRIA